MFIGFAAIDLRDRAFFELFARSHSWSGGNAAPHFSLEGMEQLAASFQIPALGRSSALEAVLPTISPAPTSTPAPNVPKGLVQQNFAGLNLNDVVRLTNSTVTPPDTMGAIGPTDFVELINGGFAVYSKTTGQAIATESDAQFWKQTAGIQFTGDITDPRIIYDPTSGRWFASAVSVPSSNPGSPQGAVPNEFLLAVSNSADPTTGWRGFAINPNAGNLFLDFPRLGVTPDAVTLVANDFKNLNGSLQSETLVSIPKADLLSLSPTLAYATILNGLDLSRYGVTIQPVTSFGAPTGQTTLLATDNNYYGLIDLTQLANAATAQPSLNAPAYISVPPTSLPNPAAQTNTPTQLETGDDRFSSEVYALGNNLWAVQDITVNGRAAIRWYEFNQQTNTLLQSGTIADASHDYFFPSIAANSFGDVVIGFSQSGPQEYASSYAVVGTSLGGVTTFGKPIQLKVGVATYSDGSSSSRWGDYSATSVDPIDPHSFWTVQEYAAAPNIWATQITQIKVS
jgi:hypothetical protein